MGKDKRYNIKEDLDRDIKRHDNPNHPSHFKNQIHRLMADEELLNYEIEMEEFEEEEVEELDLEIKKTPHC